MAQKTPRLTRRTVVLVKMESSPGVDPGPTAASDAILVGSPDFTVNPQMLKRDYVHSDLSPIGDKVGRMLAGMKFEVELRGNSFSQSGSISDAPIIGRLLRACGFSETAINAAATPRGMRAIGQQHTTVAWSVTGTNATSQYMDYQITCVEAGASGTAQLRVTELNGYESTLLKREFFTAAASSALGTVTLDASNPIDLAIAISGTWVAGDQVLFNIGGYPGTFTVQGGATDTGSIATGVAAAITALSGNIIGTATASNVAVTFSNTMNGETVSSGVTALTLGTTGVQCIPTWSGNLALGQTWKISVSPTGISYKPISISQESATLYMYVDGNLHKLTAAQGTMQLAATAGQYGKLTFTFTGQYNTPLNAALPTATVYETPLPPTFQNAQLRSNGEDITISALSFDLSNTITPRDDANSPDGYNGVRITARDPQGGVDPEMTPFGEYDPFTLMRASVYMPFSCQIGQQAGNVVWMKAPATQYTKMSYKDRQGIRVYDAGLGFAREQGDDEVEFFFC